MPLHYLEDSNLRHNLNYILSIETILDENLNQSTCCLISKMKLKYKVGISTNLWIPLSSHIYFHRSKPWHTSFMMALQGLPLL